MASHFLKLSSRNIASGHREARLCPTLDTDTDGALLQVNFIRVSARFLRADADQRRSVEKRGSDRGEQAQQYIVVTQCTDGDFPV